MDAVNIERLSVANDTDQLAHTLFELREAVNGEDWDKLRELWDELPADFQSSRSGRGIWACMKRGLVSLMKPRRFITPSTSPRANPIICTMQFSLQSTQN